jgi:hypothetical protein
LESSTHTCRSKPRLYHLRLANLPLYNLLSQQQSVFKAGASHGLATDQRRVLFGPWHNRQDIAMVSWRISDTTRCGEHA